MTESNTKLRNWLGSRDVRFWLGLIIVAFVPIVALVASVDDYRRGISLATSPFGWNRLIVIHSLSSLMLAWCFARLLGPLVRIETQQRSAAVWIGVGLVLAVLSLAVGAWTPQLLDANNAGHGVRAAVRIAWCTVLQVPWCLMVMALMARTGESNTPWFRLGNLSLLALVTAIGVPESFVAVFSGQQTAAAGIGWNQNEILLSRMTVQRLCDLGSSRMLGDKSPRQSLDDLDLSLQVIRSQLQSLEGDTPTDETRLQMADCYLALDRQADAVAVLQELGTRNPIGSLKLAQLSNSQGDNGASRDWARRTLELVQQVQPSNDEQTHAITRIGLDAHYLLALLAGDETNFDEAEKLLLESLEKYPNYAADTHARLGNHYEFIGELSKAIGHLTKAAELAPEIYAMPDSLLVKMASTGAPIGLARPKSSRYKQE